MPHKRIVHSCHNNNTYAMAYRKRVPLKNNNSNNNSGSISATFHYNYHRKHLKMQQADALARYSCTCQFAATMPQCVLLCVCVASGMCRSAHLWHARFYIYTHVCATTASGSFVYFCPTCGTVVAVACK